MPPSPEGDNKYSVRAIASRAPKLTWTFMMQGSPIAWLWSQRGAPPVDRIEPVRQPISSTFNRHVAVTAYSMTNRATVALESGLEHDLLRRLDRDHNVSRIVSQPFRLSWKGSPGRHTPDLLTISGDGGVTVWDVRAPEKQDDDFRTQRDITHGACAAVGWRYEVFGGMGQAERLNHLWISGSRRRPPWAVHYEDQILELAGRHGATIASVFQSDSGSGELKSTVWHLIWRGSLSIDMASVWTLQTAIGVSDGEAR
jgi:hypothetical protein